MGKVKFELNKEGVSQLLKSKEMQHHLIGKATEISQRCGDGYKQESSIGKKRAYARVETETYAARKDNLENNTILKAVR